MLKKILTLKKIKIEQKVEVRFKKVDKDLTLPYFTIIN